jgi:hypothetical protein
MNELQLAKIEEVFKVKLPDSFRRYIIVHPDVEAILNLTWSSDPALIKRALIDLYTETLQFDIENGNYWPKVFGECPDSLDERVAKATQYITTLPPLLPIGGRYLIPTVISDMDREPPILSFQQFVDTIYMYARLEDFLSDKPISDEDRQLLPRAVGWDKVFDGLGASDDELYKTG